MLVFGNYFTVNLTSKGSMCVMLHYSPSTDLFISASHSCKERSSMNRRTSDNNKRN